MRPRLTRHARAALALFALGAFGVSTMAASSRRLGGEQTEAVVTMNIYSGRPDPTWKLAGGELDQFLARLDAAPDASGAAGATPSLGYRGLTVSFPDGAEAELSGGRIALRGGVSLEDKGRALERWLLATGAGKVDDKAIGSARAAIDKAR